MSSEKNLDHIVQETGVQTLKSEGLLRPLRCVPRTNSFHLECSPYVLIMAGLLTVCTIETP